jgi:hypothetical protein
MACGHIPSEALTLDYLRTDMFLECRAARHCGTEPLGLREGVRAVRFWLEAA